MTDRDGDDWRAKGLAMATLLRHDLSDRDWQGAMKVLSLVAAAAGLGTVARIAVAAKSAHGDGAHGIALRRAARERLIEALGPPAAHAVRGAPAERPPLAA